MLNTTICEFGVSNVTLPIIMKAMRQYRIDGCEIEDITIYERELS